MESKTLVYSGHALRRMFERSISPADVRTAMDTGKNIESYPDDTPYPSFLILGYVKGKPLPLVSGYDDPAKECYVITVYNPEPSQWDDSFKVRIKP